MSVHCAYCGEELMGAVNRCWRCGRRFAFAPTPESEPPVRRAPIDGPLNEPETDAPYAISSGGQAHPVANGHSSNSQFSNSHATTATAPIATSSAAATAESPEPSEEVVASIVTANPNSTIPVPARVTNGATPEPTAGRLRVVSRSEATHLGSPFEQFFELDLRTRWAVWSRGLIARLATWGQSLKKWKKGQAVAKNQAADMSPLRRALANSSFAMALLLGIVAWCIRDYALIAIVMASMGLGLTGVSLLAAPRWRVFVPALVCFVLLFHTTYVEYEAWSRQQAIKQGLLPPDTEDDELR